MVLLRLFGIPRTSTLYTCTPNMGPFQTPFYRNRFNDYRGCIDYLFVLYSGYTRRNSFHTSNRNRMGFLHNQLCDSYNGYVPYVHMYKPPEFSTTHNRNVETQLWYIFNAHILARTMGDCVQAHIGTTNCCRHTQHCSKYICMLLYNDKNYLAYTWQ